MDNVYDKNDDVEKHNLQKGSDSRILRWGLLYFNHKLSLRPIIASHKILSLFKG